MCKRSAVRYGYWSDPYLEAMIPAPSRVSGDSRKAPEIHLGYFTRIKGLWHLLDRVVSLCVDADSNYQVINLGAGYDTLYWRLKAAPTGKVNFRLFLMLLYLELCQSVSYKLHYMINF